MRTGSNLYPEYTVRRLSPELLSKLKPRVYELDGTEYVRSRVALLEVGVLAGSILRDYRHEFERVDDGGLWVSVVLWVSVRDGRGSYAVASSARICSYTCFSRFLPTIS